MFFFNPGSNPLLAFLQGGTVSSMGMGNAQPPWRPGQQELLSMQMQQSQYIAGLNAQRAAMQGQIMFGPRPEDVVRSDVIAQTPFVGPREPAKVALEQFKPPEKDITPDPEFECAQCGHPGPKDRLNGCQVCGGMVWK
jgi:hypothetical protein